MTHTLAVSPLTGNVYFGKLNKAKNAFVGEKQDLKNDFLRSIIEYAEFHKGEFQIVGGDKKWTVTVKEEQPPCT